MKHFLDSYKRLQPRLAAVLLLAALAGNGVRAQERAASAPPAAIPAATETLPPALPVSSTHPATLAHTESAVAATPRTTLANASNESPATASDSATVNTANTDKRTTFAEASRLYQQGDYAAAAAGFRALVAEQPALAAFYNLGNALYMSGNRGGAIAAYEKALALAPGNPEVKANLASARAAANLPPQALSAWQRFVVSPGPDLWALLALAGLWATLLLWLVPPLYREKNGLWRPAGLVCSLAVLVISAAALWQWSGLVKTGVILEADTPLLAAPAAGSPVQSYLQAGAQAREIKTHNGYYRIRLASGSEGWVKDTRFERIWQ